MCLFVYVFVCLFLNVLNCVLFFGGEGEGGDMFLVIVVLGLVNCLCAFWKDPPFVLCSVCAVILVLMCCTLLCSFCLNLLFGFELFLLM